MNLTNFTDWPAWLQILTAFAAWVSLYLWTAKTQRGQYARTACALTAILFYFLFLRPSRH
jgi:hypothetical protein